MTIPFDNNPGFDSREVISIDMPAQTATGTFPLLTLDDSFRILAIEFLNPTGLATSGTDFFAFALKAGATTAATFSTATTAIAAGVSTLMVLSATDLNTVAPQGSLLSLALTLTGTQTLPAGRVVIHGKYVA